MGVARSSSGRVMKSQGEGAILGVFFPNDNALYSIAFGSHTETAKPIEMPFGVMTRLGLGTMCDMGDPTSEGGSSNFWGGGNVAAHCNITGHFTVSCATRARQQV